jgi:tetratricopeptide (TPR) repeat protein
MGVGIALAAGALAQGAGQLPPGHPPLDGAGKATSAGTMSAPSAGSLPPGHPSLDGAGKMSAGQPLPPGHPSMDGSGASSGSGSLPPGHPSLDGAGSSGAGASSAPPAMPPGHPPMREGAAPPTADELLQRLDAQPDLKARDKSFDVAVAVGKLYYSSARYAEAAEYLGQAWSKSERARQLYLQQIKKVSAPLSPPDACRGPMELRALVAEMEKRAGANDAAGAAGCGAMAMDQVLEAEEMRGNALAVDGNPKGAVESYQRVLQVDPKRESSLYFHAMALIESRPDDVASLKTAKADLSNLLATAEASNRRESVQRTADRLDLAIAAGGFTKLASNEAAVRKAKGPPKTPPFVARALAAQGQGGMGMGGPGPMQSGDGDHQGPTPEQVQRMAEAAQTLQRTPEVEAGFAQLVEQGEASLAKGAYQAALDAYKRVVPFQPENGRAKAGMAWAMVGLNRQPMADRVWMVAVSSDPAAVDHLGDMLKQKGDAQGAKALWAKLKASAPDYAASSGLDKKLN